MSHRPQILRVFASVLSCLGACVVFASDHLDTSTVAEMPEADIGDQ